MGAPTKANVDELIRIDKEFARSSSKTAAAEFDDVRTWVDPRGHRLSDRVWDARQSVREQIDTVLRDAVANRTDALVVAKQLEQYLNPAYALARGPDGKILKNQARGIVTAAPGRGGQGSYAARRLARTEISRSHAQATHKASGLTPFAIGWQWNTSSSHPKPDECDDHADRDEGLGPGVYPPNGGPRMPSHPLCLCYATIVTRKDTDAVIAELRREYGLDPGGSGEAIGGAIDVSRIAPKPASTPDLLKDLRRFDPDISLKKAAQIAKNVDDETYGRVVGALEDVREKYPDYDFNVKFGHGDFKYPTASGKTIEIDLDNVRRFAEKSKGFDPADYVDFDPRAYSVYHEFGHVGHGYKLFGDPEGLLLPIRTLNASEKVIARRVSLYSTEASTEFIADTFAKTAMGQHFDDEVYALYRKFDGPDLEPFLRKVDTPEFVPVKTVDRAIEEAKKFNITLDGVKKADVDIVNELGPHWQELHRRGVLDGDSRVIRFIDGRADEGFAAHNAGDDVISISRRYQDLWTGKSDAALQAEKFLPNRRMYLVSNDAKDLFTHELGHQNHWRRMLDPEKFARLRRDQIPDDLYPKIVDEISVYGGSNPLEFVAETYTKITRGETISDDLLDYYRKLDGPDLEPFLRKVDSSPRFGPFEFDATGTVRDAGVKANDDLSRAILHRDPTFRVSSYDDPKVRAVIDRASEDKEFLDTVTAYRRSNLSSGKPGLYAGEDLTSLTDTEYAAELWKRRATEWEVGATGNARADRLMFSIEQEFGVVNPKYYDVAGTKFDLESVLNGSTELNDVTTREAATLEIKLLRRLVRSQYDETQAYIKQLEREFDVDLSRIRVYRGLAFNSEPKMFRGLADSLDARQVTLETRPATSWTISKDQVRVYADSLPTGKSAKYGYVGSGEVTADQIIFMPGSGVGSAFEGEIVTIGNRYDVVFRDRKLGVPNLTTEAEKIDVLVHDLAEEVKHVSKTTLKELVEEAQKPGTTTRVVEDIVNIAIDESGTRTALFFDLENINFTNAVNIGTDLGKNKKLLNQMADDLRRSLKDTPPYLRKQLEEKIDDLYRAKRKELSADYKRFLKSRPDVVKRTNKVKKVEGLLSDPPPRPKPLTPDVKRSVDHIKDAIKKADVSNNQDLISATRDVKTVGRMIREEINTRFDTVGRRKTLRDAQDRLEKAENSWRNADTTTKAFRAAEKEYDQAVKDLSLAMKESQIGWRREDIVSVLSDIREDYGKSVKSLDLVGGTTSSRQAMSEASRYFPKEWWDEAAEKRIKLKVTSRGEFRAGDGTFHNIQVSTNSMWDNARHEMAHLMEHNHKKIGQLEREFYEQRTPGELLEWLGPPYPKSESYRPDRWVHKYMGKDYRGFRQESDHWEILTMGVEELFSATPNPKMLLDDDFVDFILGILTSI